MTKTEPAVYFLLSSVSQLPVQEHLLVKDETKQLLAAVGRHSGRRDLVDFVFLLIER